MDENKAHDESGTPFDGSSVPASEMPAALQTSISKTAEEKTVERLPDNVKIGGWLLIAHGACLGLNGILYGRQANDNGNILSGLIWFGCTFVLCGALFERKAWAWWIVTLVGGGIGVINLLASIGAFLSRTLLRSDESVGVSFIPPVIFLGAIAMLISVALLLTPAAKSAFGMSKIQ